MDDADGKIGVAELNAGKHRIHLFHIPISAHDSRVSRNRRRQRHASLHYLLSFSQHTTHLISMLSLGDPWPSGKMNAECGEFRATPSVLLSKHLIKNASSGSIFDCQYHLCSGLCATSKNSIGGARSLTARSSASETVVESHSANGSRVTVLSGFQTLMIALTRCHVSGSLERHVE